MANNNSPFTFEISLSVLNHLGRNLYRSFITVLGEAISNAWDADAENVWIYIDRDEDFFIVKDDGNGMTAEDFQNRFLRIGYSKRKDGSTSGGKNRPYIGRKGIGKLALLSCAQRISVLTRTSTSMQYVGGVIDNTGLNNAIQKELTPEEYQLGNIDQALFEKHIQDHEHGTIIYFEDVNDGIKNSVAYLTQLIALYFRFSLLDNSFIIHVNDKPVTMADLDYLADKTQFLWNINGMNDPYIAHLKHLRHTIGIVSRSDLPIKGFIASVERPRNLKIPSTGEKVGIDLFVNGRLREKDILKHFPTARVVESYLYGQIHCNSLDEEAIDRFTSSREGIVADDPKFQELLEAMKEIVLKIIEDWDVWRLEIRQPGDSENTRISTKDRASKDLFNVVSSYYTLPEESSQKKLVEGWVEALAGDAQFNFSSYAECFVSENLVRKYIEDRKIALSTEAEQERDLRKTQETNNKNRANISIDIRRAVDDLGYLSMEYLANLVDKVKDPNKQAGLSRDALEYKPMRDALAHTSLLTEPAKDRLTAVYENIKARVQTLLATP